jgi:hypothetical protein
MDSIGEQFGNALVPGYLGVAHGLLPLVNDSHRVYLRNVDSDRSGYFLSCYFAGDTAAVHAALRQFAAVERGLDVVLLPGPREVTSFDGKRKLSADWELHIPGRGPRPARRGLRALSLAGDTRPTLYLYVRAADRPAAPATADQVAGWLAALDAEKFEDRERASRELEKQGFAVTGALRKALEGQPPAEARRRIGLLLAKLESLAGINLGVLDVPQGVRVLGPDDLLTHYRQKLKGPDSLERTEVVEVVTRLGPDPSALEILTQALSDKQLYSQQRAAEILRRMGKAAAPALPALRAGLHDPVPFVRASCQEAIAAIEAAKDESELAERAKAMQQAREQIGRFVESRKAVAGK